MKHILGISTCATLCVGLLAQTPARTAAKPAVSGTEEHLSNEDANIRTYMQLLRTDIRKSKSQIMGEVMQLDTDQAQKFWPIYKDFETELSKLGDRW